MSYSRLGYHLTLVGQTAGGEHRTINRYHPVSEAVLDGMVNGMQRDVCANDYLIRAVLFINNEPPKTLFSVAFQKETYDEHA